MRWWYVAGAFIMGIVLTGTASFLLARSANAKLTADLAGVRTSLELAESNRADLAKQLRLVSGELERANRLAASQQSIISGQQQRIERQQLVIDAAKRGLADLSKSIAGSGGDIGKQIRVFAEGYRRLFALYNKSSK